MWMCQHSPSGSATEEYLDVYDELQQPCSPSLLGAADATPAPELARLVEQSKPATSFQRHQAELAKREAEVVALVKKREKQQAEKASLEAEVRELKQQIWAEGGYAAGAGKGVVLNEHFLGKEHGYVKGRTIEAPKKRILVLKRKEPGGLCWEETASEEKKKVTLGTDKKSKFKQYIEVRFPLGECRLQPMDLLLPSAPSSNIHYNPEAKQRIDAIIAQDAAAAQQGAEGTSNPIPLLTFPRPTSSVRLEEVREYDADGEEQTSGAYPTEVMFGFSAVLTEELPRLTARIQYAPEYTHKYKLRAKEKLLGRMVKLEAPELSRKIAGAKARATQMKGILEREAAADGAAPEIDHAKAAAEFEKLLQESAEARAKQQQEDSEAKQTARAVLALREFRAVATLANFIAPPQLLEHGTDVLDDRPSLERMAKEVRPALQAQRARTSRADVPARKTSLPVPIPRLLRFQV
eukprot:g5009.t1